MGPMYYCKKEKQKAEKYIFLLPIFENKTFGINENLQYFSENIFRFFPLLFWFGNMYVEDIILYSKNKQAQY